MEHLMSFISNPEILKRKHDTLNTLKTLVRVLQQISILEMEMQQKKEMQQKNETYGQLRAYVESQRDYLQGLPESLRKYLEVDRLLTATPQRLNDWDTCPVCYLERHECIPIDGPANSDILTKCPHYLCVSCWRAICKTQKAECPLCREDVSEWLYSHYGYDDDSDDEDIIND